MKENKIQTKEKNFNEWLEQFIKKIPFYVA